MTFKLRVDFALPLAEQTRNSIFLPFFFYKCFDCIACLDLVLERGGFSRDLGGHRFPEVYPQ